MEHLLEISRIIDGAIKGDKAKVVAYVEQLEQFKFACSYCR